MSNFAKTAFRSALITCLCSASAFAFSLLGPFDTYQTPDWGYNPDVSVNNPDSDKGGPMNLNEEYRWNAPVIVYGFDNSFIEFFGNRGVEAVEQAVSIINALPAVSEMSHSLTEYPLDTLRFNYTAQSLAIVDVKSLALSLLLEQLGLAAPERYAKTIRDRKPDPDDPNTFVYAVITRNFSPVPVTGGDIRSYSYSPYVNGSLYTYVVRHVTPPPAEYWDAQDIAVDVANPRLSVASFAGTQAAVVDPRITRVYSGRFNFGTGVFFSGLTRDDVGGLRYLYHPGRTNVEALPANSVAGGGGGIVSGGGGGGGVSGSPWTITVPFISTNAVAATNTTTGTGNLVNLAWRGGVDRLLFVRIDPDPFIAQYRTPLNLDYTERVFDAARNRFVNQSVRRVFSRPDITFTAEDLGMFDNNAKPYQMDRTIGAFNNRSVENSGIGRGGAGPGTIDSGGVGSRITFNKLGPWSYNESETSEDDSTLGFIFGSFDGTTNSPTVYPTGVTAKELEQFIYGRN